MKEAEEGEGHHMARGSLLQLAETASLDRYMDDTTVPVNFQWYHKMLRYQQQLEQDEAVLQKRQSLRSKIREKQERRRKQYY